MRTSSPPFTSELPLLRIGLAGFSPGQRHAIATALASRAARGGLAWQVAPLGEADAWCVEGARVRCLPDGTLEIVSAGPSGRGLRFDPGAVDWPVAFSAPAGPPGFRPDHVFDLDNPASLHYVLERMEGWLRPLIVQFCLASHLVQARPDFCAGVYHVTVRGRLHAVVSPRTGVGVWPIADPAHLAHAVWSRRPESAEAIPASFMRVGFAEALWQYATRTARDCLPPHYRARRLFLRRPPALPLRLLSDAALLVLRELGAAPATLDELRRRTGLPDGQLSRQLGALSLVGAVTTDARRAPLRPAVPDSDGWAPSLLADSGGSVPGAEAQVTVRLKVSGPARVPQEA